MISSLKAKSNRADKQPAARDRRPFIALGGAVALVVVGIAMYLLLFAGNSGSNDAMLGPVALPTRSANASAAPSVTLAPVAVAGTRDPFNSANVVPAVAVAPTSGASVSAVPTASSTPTPSASGTQFVFKLVDLSKTTTTVLVNGHVYTPAVGDQFGTFFRLYAIFGSTCAGYQFGTQNVALCKGDSTVLTQ